MGTGGRARPVARVPVLPVGPARRRAWTPRSSLDQAGRRVLLIGAGSVGTAVAPGDDVDFYRRVNAALGTQPAPGPALLDLVGSDRARVARRPHEPPRSAGRRRVAVLPGPFVDDGDTLVPADDVDEFIELVLGRGAGLPSRPGCARSPPGRRPGHPPLTSLLERPTSSVSIRLSEPVQGHDQLVARIVGGLTADPATPKAGGGRLG